MNERAMMAMPTDAAAMRTHLEGKHAMSPADVAEMPMADMQSKHNTMHGSDVGHTHTSMNALPTGREVRIATEAWPTEDLEFRAEGDGMTFRGYAAVFDKPSDDLGGFREKVRPGAFAKTLSEKRAIKMFWNHNTDIPLGSTRSGLTLTEDGKGLLAEARLPDTTAGRDMSVLIRDGIVDSMSFGFQMVKDSWSDDQKTRDLIEARLFEVSPVTAWPAYPQTSASVRELAAEIAVEPDTLAEAFRVLREPEGRLSDEQHQLLITLLNARHASSVMPIALAKWRERLASLESAAV